MNQDPQLERRLLLAFALSMVLFVLVMRFGPKPAPTPPAPPATAATTAAATAPAAAPGNPAAPAPAATAPGKPAAAPASSAAAPAPVTLAAASEQTETIDTPVYRIVLSNRGAGVRSWILKQYTDTDGHPLDAVDPAFSAVHGWPLEFYSADAAAQAQLRGALYTVTRTGAGDRQAITFEWSANGLHATKTLTFGAGYEISVAASLARNGQPLPAQLAWSGALTDRASANDFPTEQVVLQPQGAKVQTLPAKKVANGTTQSGQFQLAGVEDQYFAAIFLPRDPNAALTVTQLKSSDHPRWVDSAAGVDVLGVAVGGATATDARLFLGPKEISLLRAVDPALRNLVDFGVFTFVAEPLFLWMNWTYQHWVHNYGWVIVIITFLLSLATLPLKLRAQKSQIKMQQLAPQVNALNAKMKKYGMRDPRRAEMQQQVMKLYSDAGVNPLGGCLPMLLQLPLVWAFYRVLGNAIELRHAGWFGYVHDLSAKDPYYLLPLALVVSQFLSMQYMPMAPGQDPRQMKMMKWMMPAMMGYIFFYFPSGVNLYYLVNNLLGVAQQIWLNRIYGVKLPAAKPRRA